MYTYISSYIHIYMYTYIYSCIQIHTEYTYIHVYVFIQDVTNVVAPQPMSVLMERCSMFGCTGGICYRTYNACSH